MRPGDRGADQRDAPEKDDGTQPAGFRAAASDASAGPRARQGRADGDRGGRLSSTADGHEAGPPSQEPFGIGAPGTVTTAWIEPRGAASRPAGDADFAKRSGHVRAFAKSFSVCASQITWARAGPDGRTSNDPRARNNRELPRPSRSTPRRRAVAFGKPNGRRQRSLTGRTTVRPRHVAPPARSADLRFLPLSTAPSTTDADRRSEIIDAP